MKISARAQHHPPAAPITRSRTGPNKRGFTLLELIITLVILGLLAAIAIPTYQRIITHGENAAAEGTVESALRNAVANAALERRGLPSASDVQDAFDGLAATATSAGVNAAGTYTVCEYGDDTCEPTGILVEYYRPTGQPVAGIVVHGERTVLGNITRNTVTAWVRSNGTVLDAITGADRGSGDHTGIDADDPTYRSVSATTANEIEVIYESTTEATVDVQVRGGLAIIVAMPLDDNGDPVDGSPHGCGAVNRTVISGSGFAVNCPGDTGYNEYVHGSPHGVACDSNCRIQLSSDRPFIVATLRIDNQYGGANFTAQAVARLVG